MSDQARAFIKHIQDALGTAEEGEALIEVARNAHKAEQELAAFINRMKSGEWTFEAAYARINK